MQAVGNITTAFFRFIEGVQSVGRELAFSPVKLYNTASGTFGVGERFGVAGDLDKGLS